MGFKQSPFPMTEGTKAHSSALKIKESSEFEKAFASARKEQGAGGEFEFKGKKYSTARKDDPSVSGQFISKDLKDVGTGEQYKDPHGHIKRHKSGDVEDIDYTVHKGKITGTK